MSFRTRRTIISLLTIIFFVIVTLLSSRVLFRLMGANAATPGFTWIYTITNYLTLPFEGIMKNPVFAGTIVLDVVSLLALITYMVTMYVLIIFMQSLTEQGK